MRSFPRDLVDALAELLGQRNILSEVEQGNRFEQCLILMLTQTQI
jgi:hypothetical protein